MQWLAKVNFSSYPSKINQDLFEYQECILIFQSTHPTLSFVGLIDHGLVLGEERLLVRPYDGCAQLHAFHVVCKVRIYIYIVRFVGVIFSIYHTRIIYMFLFIINLLIAHFILMVYFSNRLGQLSI